TLGVVELDDNLKLKEFSKSLIDKSYTLYVNIIPGSINSWGQMCRMFREKFFSTQEKTPNFIHFFDQLRFLEESRKEMPLSLVKIVDSRRTFIDDGYSVNLMPLSALKEVKIDMESLRHLMTITSFENKEIKTLG
ncbi:hypothetical protein Goshw_023670, partial [Gossypium schwendimanii]|nr:hypothetical protein [Gossypium schwendimanii]